MNTTAIITTAIIFLFFIIMHIISVYNKKKKENKILSNITRLSGINIHNITQYDVWNNSVIGMDDSAAEIYFIRNSSDDQSFQKVQLSEIQRCWLNEVSRSVFFNGSSVKVVEKVELKMDNKGKAKTDTVIEFYNQDSGKLDLSGELQLADKWCKILNDKIASISK